MAKKCMIERESKRERLCAKYAARRQRFKAVLASPNSSEDEKVQAVLALQAIPRNASPVRKQRRCAVTGRPHAVYRKFALSRNMLREYSMLGYIPGLKKASW